MRSTDTSFDVKRSKQHSHKVEEHKVMFNKSTKRTLQSKLETLLFSGKNEDFEYSAERFEARLLLLKLRTTLLDQGNSPEDTDVNSATEQSNLKEKRFEVWCELVQYLDRKPLSLVKTAKPNGIQAWKLLQDCFKKS